MEAYTMGRGKNNTLVIDSNTVSNEHALLIKNDNNTYTIEDISDGYGVFVNGVRIIKKQVAHTDEIKIHNTTVNIKQITGDYSEEFAELEPVYNDFVNKKKKNNKKQSVMPHLYRIAFIAGAALLAYGICSYLNIKIQYTIAIIGGGLLAGLLTPSAKNKNELMDLIEEHKNVFVCPACKRYLGNDPWENYKNQEKCPHKGCKAKW